MNKPHDPNLTVDESSLPADSLDAGLAVGFGPPRSTLGEMRPVLLKEAEGESAHIVQPKSDAMPSPEQTGDRYQLQGEIVRGGMGAVLRGRDVDLGRDLAVKVLLEKYTDRPEVARRFIEEAQIGGQLQHPGVVAVYDIGRFGARPFFTMKLVKGQTLAALLEERRDKRLACPSGQRTSEPLVPTDLPRFLAIALDVAQTIAYAHAKGVIHRDLKPANVMVGAFGEVQVMDWGLAKVLVEGGVADEEKASRAHQAPQDVTTIRTARSSGSTGSLGTDTEAGSLLGTPAYMPPEQANGDIANLDRRADVFGLGAILCEILTGKPPYVGRSGEEVRRKACNGDLADALARLNGCGADEELIVLTKACLAPEAIDRPKDARAVAEALTTYLNGVQERLHQAELAEAEARAKAVEEAKRRRLTLALAATVLLAVTLGGGGWLYVKNERDARRAQLTRDVNDALTQATALREKAKTATTGGAALFAQAREQAQRALALIENGPADEVLTEQVRRLQSELDEEEKDRILVAALDEARLAQAETQSGENRFASERAVPKFREAFAAYGLPAGEGEPEAAAQRIRQRPAAVREAIIAALEEWDDLAGNPEYGITEPHRKWLRAVLAAAEPEDALGRKLRAASAAIRQHAKADAAYEKDVSKQRAALENLAASVDVTKVPARVLTRLAGRLAPAPRVALLRRAQRQYPADFWINHELGFWLRFVTPPQYEEAVRFATAAAALRPESPGTHFNLGRALYDLGRMDDAIISYQKALELEPKYAAVHSELGRALMHTGQRDEAIACWRKAIEVDPTFALAHNNLGAALCDSKHDYDEAIASFKKALELDPNYAPAHLNLGNALKSKGQVDEAIVCFRKVIELAPKYANAHSLLGIALQRKGRLDEAIASFHKAVELDAKEVQTQWYMGQNPVLVIGGGRAFTYAHLGEALEEKGRLDEAITCYRKAIELDPKSAGAHIKLGIALYSKGQMDEAIACLRKAIELDPKEAVAHGAQGNALLAKGQVNEAIDCYKKAIELDPKNAKAHVNLGAALFHEGQVDEAIASVRKALELEPKNAEFHNNLGFALERKGQLDEAIASFRKVVELAPKDAHSHYNLGNLLRKNGQLDEAIASFRKALEIDPKYAEAHCNLGSVLKEQGRFAESVSAYTRGHELGTKQPGWRYPSAQWVRQAESLAALEAKLPAFLQGEFKPKDTTERLGLVGVCQAKKLHHAATRLYADAFAADPKLDDDPTASHRYNAACSAALAAAGQGEDAAKLDEKEKARVRKQALEWLRGDLALRTKRLESGQPAERTAAQNMLRHSQRDSDLAGIRDTAALDKLQAEERAACEKLWADVAALLKKAETPAKKDAK
jgi:serine/threonine-protein kinase